MSTFMHDSAKITFIHHETSVIAEYTWSKQNGILTFLLFNLPKPPLH